MLIIDAIRRESVGPEFHKALTGSIGLKSIWRIVARLILGISIFFCSYVREFTFEEYCFELVGNPPGLQPSLTRLEISYYA